MERYDKQRERLQVMNLTVDGQTAIYLTAALHDSKTRGQVSKAIKKLIQLYEILLMN